MNATERLPEPAANIMIVDDRPANLQLLVEFLRGEGYKVRPVTSGLAAIELAARIRPDLVLLDVNMPDLGGHEVCRRLKANPALVDVPVLFLSAMIEAEDKLRGFEAGGEDYITKPFQMREVQARIGTHLRLARLRAQVNELATLREHLAHMLVHDLRSPLFGIAGLLELAEISPGVAGDAAARRFIHDARASARAMVEMLSDILDVYKMESGHAVAQPRPAPLAEVLERAIHQAGGSLLRERLAYTPPESDCIVHCDVALTSRVVANLLANAVKFSPAGAPITLGVERRAAQIGISVRDEGPGIREQDQQGVFDKFASQMKPGEGRRYSTGLGLVFCKMAVEEQGGEIGVNSRPGVGSTFWFTLPLASPTANKEQEHVPGGSPTL